MNDLIFIALVIVGGTAACYYRCKADFKAIDEQYQRDIAEWKILDDKVNNLLK
jgi:hypothetical protein